MKCFTRFFQNIDEYVFLDLSYLCLPPVWDGGWPIQGIARKAKAAEKEREKQAKKEKKKAKERDHPPEDDEWWGQEEDEEGEYEEGDDELDVE